ncbi:MAG: sigma-54-dependent Fis family transcriptional regulator [Deltaproteobacteria bacterium]|nr:sigma-54-dependent Fis family transcriptional regulator [Deltaproteobacteria bacterium]
MTPPEGMLGQAPAMVALRERIARLAPLGVPVLIHGETGTGKELVAAALHHGSGRSGALVPVDCAALAEGLVESELFGHTRGAFTGAVRDRTGLVDEADGGTLFLDEVGELPMEAQSRLLRVLETGELRAVGAPRWRRVEVRVIAATWRDLRARVAEGLFREDLYYRLVAVELEVPPLRDRGEDIAALAHHFVAEVAAAHGRPPPSLAPETLALLAAHRWPGNVRELRNLAAWIGALGPPEVGPGDLPPAWGGRMPREAPEVPEVRRAVRLEAALDLPYLEARRALLDDFQARYAEAALARAEGNLTRAAREAGMDRRLLQRILARGR